MGKFTLQWNTVECYCQPSVSVQCIVYTERLQKEVKFHELYY